MENNFNYYYISKEKPEELFDSFYAKKKIVIPMDASVNNLLTANNKKLIDNITAFKVLVSQGYKENSKPIQDILEEIVNILTNTPNINLSPFVQFFMVYNSTYSYFLSLNIKEKFKFVYQMLIKYCQERHDMYCSHGYSSSTLQVLCDNYSHKRNSKTTIEKVVSLLAPYNLKRLRNASDLENLDNFYFLPDKGDKNLFDNFINLYNLKMESRQLEQDKYPDLVFKHNNHYFICELKTMKGSGGGQNKQIVEVACFIKYSELNPYFHYLVFLDGDYSNILYSSSKPKIEKQRKDILKALENNPNNYFVNTNGFKKLLEDVFN